MQLTIIYESGSRKGTQKSLDVKGAIRLGRHPDNDCVFEAPEDQSVSGFHAEIRLVEGLPVVKDMGSRNGLFVNGEHREESQLVFEDTVELGKGGPRFRVQVTPHSSPKPEKKYGERTVGMLIQQALAQAGLIGKKGTSKSTDYFESMVEKKVKSTWSRQKRIMVATVVTLLVAGGLLGYFLYRNRSVQVFQTTQVNYGDATGGSIAATNRYTVFVLAGQHRETGEFRGFCTAFAISSNILATNAHCIKTGQKKFTNLKALMNGAPANRYSIIRVYPHPGYQEGRISPDVGLLLVHGHLSQTVTIARTQELSQVTPGTVVFLYGFPGRLNKEEAPEATFIKGDIGRVTTFDQRLGNFGQNSLLQHSAFSSSGTSGSPMFNSAGRVIGINSGGYLENGKPLSGYNFGMRIDLITPLFQQLKAK